MKAVQFSLALALVAFGVRAWAGEHPVPLEKNVDAAKCLECHEDKSKGKNVHSAIAMGCTTCHEVKVEGEVTKVELNQPKEELCFTCHAKEAKEEDTKHGPWDRGQCVFCHDPHVSDYSKQLRAEGNALCLECHTKRDPLPEKIEIFKAHDMPPEEWKEARKLRLSPEGDRGHPLANHWVAIIPDPTRPGQKMACLTCHVPHSSPEDKLARIVTAKDKDGKDVKLDVCNACHDAYDRLSAERRIQSVPQVEKQIQEQQAEAIKKRQEYLKKLPKVAGDERDQPK